MAQSPGVSPSDRQARFERLQAELDPNNSHGPRKLGAALKMLGLEPEDLDLAPAPENIKVSSKIPDPALAEKVKKQRAEVLEGLRKSRIEKLENTLNGDGLGPQEISHYERAGDGVRAVQPDDIDEEALVGEIEYVPKTRDELLTRLGECNDPDELATLIRATRRHGLHTQAVQAHQRMMDLRQKAGSAGFQNSKSAAEAGTLDFHELQNRKFEQLKAEQQRKANKLVRGFLEEKKRQEEADAKLSALEKRLKEHKKTQAEAAKTRATEQQKKTERRQQLIERIAQEESEKADEDEKKVFGKLEAAKDRRMKSSSTGCLRSKVAETEKLRHEAFQKSVDLEEKMLLNIQTRTDELELRLQERREQVEKELQLRREASQTKFSQSQVKVHQLQHKWAEDKLKQHEEFKDKVKTNRVAAQKRLVEKSKSCGEITRKAHDKWRSNYERLQQVQLEEREKLLEKDSKAARHLEAIQSLKLKNGGDVHSFQEVKNGTFGLLQQTRYQELQKSHDARAQELVFKIAEFDTKQAIKQEASDELSRRRQLIDKESLALDDRAREGFLRIQCEPDERKIVTMMSNLGFDMPKLPDEEDE